MELGSHTYQLEFLKWRCDRLFDYLVKNQFELDVKYFDQVSDFLV